MVEDTFLEPITKSGKRINYLSAAEQAKRRDQFMALPGVSDKVNAMAESLGVTPDEILYVIKKETAGSYSSKQKNLGGGSATGLIQFLGTGGDKGKGGKTVGGTFYSYSDLENMSTLEQLDVVESYFNKNFKAKGGKPGELYVAVAAPAYVGKADGSTVVYKAGSQNAKDNKGWQNEDGNVTLDSLKSFGATEGFVTYTPQVKSSSSEVNSGDKGEEDLLTKRKEQVEKSAKLTADYILSPEEEEEVQGAAVETASDIHARIKRGELKGSDDDIKNIYYKELAEKIRVTDIDTNDPNALGRARGFIEYATSFSNEELGERVGGEQVWDSKIEDALENWSNNVNWNLEVLGIPKKGQLTTDTPLFSGSVSSVPGTATAPNITPPDVELENIIQKDSKLTEERAKTGETAAELADRKLAEQQTLDNSLQTGVERGEDIAEYSDIEEEEDDIDTLLKEGQESIQKDKDAEAEAKRLKRMQNAELALGGLKAAAGVLSLSKALRDPEVDVPEISPLVYEALNKQKQLANSGLTAAEKNAAMQNLNNAYAGAMKNVLRASGGQRGLFLANQGTVDANRIAGLNQLAAQDAELHRENIKQYNALATSVGQMTLNRDMTVEQMKQTTMNQNRKVLGGIGTNLLSDALSDAGAYLDPNRELYQKITRNTLENMANMQSQGYTNPYLNETVGTADTDPNEESEETEKPE